MPAVTILSPAKLNIFLRVRARRPDGYHELLTLFERIDLCDELSFTTAPGRGRIRITADDPQVPCGPKNLIHRAARLLQETCGEQGSVSVRVKKRIPVAAGLGGGSSNAAHTLIALNRLWKLRLGRPRLVELGRQLGADVPFFLYDCHWAVGTGRGDLIRPLELGVKIGQILIVPRTKMYSREVFRALEKRLTKGNDDVNILTRSIRKKDFNKLGSLLSNDLEKPILALRPGLSRVKERMRACGLEYVSFSGSGPSVFALTTGRRGVVEAVRRLQRYYRRVYAVRTY